MNCNRLGSISRFLFPLLIGILFSSVNLSAQLLDDIDVLIEEGEYAAAFEAIRSLENSAVSESRDDASAFQAALLWRKAWTMVNRTRLEESLLSKNELIGDYEKALGWAARALEISPDSSRSWYWYGVAAGALGEQKGIFAALREIDVVRNSMLRSIALEPSFSDPWITLARLYDALPGIMGGDRDAAVLLARIGLSVSGGEQEGCSYSGKDIEVLRSMLEKRNYSTDKRRRLAERRREDPDWIERLLPGELQGLIPFIRNHPGTIHTAPCTPGLSDWEEAARLPGVDSVEHL